MKTETNVEMLRSNVRYILTLLISQQRDDGGITEHAQGEKKKGFRTEWPCLGLHNIASENSVYKFASAVQAKRPKEDGATGQDWLPLYQKKVACRPTGSQIHCLAQSKSCIAHKGDCSVLCVTEDRTTLHVRFASAKTPHAVLYVSGAFIFFIACCASTGDVPDIFAPRT